MAAGQLGGQLYPTGQAIDADPASPQPANLSFGRAIQAWNRHDYTRAVALFNEHVAEHPDDPWTGEATLHLGCEARFNGRYRDAEERFTKLIEENQGAEAFGARMLASRARSRLAVLKVLQNNLEEAGMQFAELKRTAPDWRARTYASHWIQRLSRYKANRLALLNCGSLAVSSILRSAGDEWAAREVLAVRPTSPHGQSVADLRALGGHYGYTFRALQLSVDELSQVPLPAIVQVSGRAPGDRGHYWIVEELADNRLTLFDPQSRRRFRQSREAFAAEWDGNALVMPGEPALPGRELSAREVAAAYGGCCGAQRPETGLGDPRVDAGPLPGPDDGCGEPTWAVNMVNMNLFVTDTPLWYSPPVGPPVEISLSYNSQSAMAFHEPFGNKWQFNYASYLLVDPGDVVTLFMPDGRRDVYTPDGAGGYDHPLRVHHELRKLADNHFELRLLNGTVYVYDIPTGTTSLQPFLVEVRDSYGNSVAFSYDASVQLVGITDAAGRTTTLTYDGDGLVSAVSDPFGRSASFEYDLNRNLVRITDMGGYVSNLTYDADVYITGIEKSGKRWGFYIEPSDGVDAYADNYSPPGDYMFESYRITVTNPLGDPEEYYYWGGSGSVYGSAFSWHVSPRDYIPYQSATENNFYGMMSAPPTDTPKTRFLHTRYGPAGELGTVSRVEFPGGGSLTTTAYDANLYPLGVRDSHGHTTYYNHNARGQITSTIDPGGNSTSFVYDPNTADLIEILDGRGSIRLAYNAAHDLVSYTNRSDDTLTLDYNSLGQVTSITHPLLAPTLYAYDPDHQLIEITRAGQTLEQLTHDLLGRVETRTDETGLTLRYAYNALDDLTAITYPDGKSVTFSYASCCPHLLESTTDRSGRTTRFSYDALGRLIAIENPEGGLTRLLYDANRNLTRIQDANGNTTRFAYDIDGRLIRRSYADGSSIWVDRDPEGLVIKRINARGLETDYAYDSNHALLAIDYSDATPDVSFQYDPYHRLTSHLDGTGTYTYSYGAADQLLSIDGPLPNDTVSYAYDALLRRTSLTVGGIEVAAYTYGPLSRLASVGKGSDSYAYTYSGAGPLVERLLRPNGCATSYQYDLLRRLIGLTHKTSTQSLIRAYTYGYSQQDLRETESVTNPTPAALLQDGLLTFDYNVLNQLIASGDPARLFSHDADGNMTRGYTPAGDVLNATYDAENRLVTLEDTDSEGVVHRIDYGYRADGFLARAVELEDGSPIRESWYVRDGHSVLEEREGGGSVSRQYLWAPGEAGGIGGLLAVSEGGQDYAYLYDARGSVASLIDQSETVVAAYTYNPFGVLLAQAGSVDQPFRFSTKRYHERTGLSYFGHRFYASLLGRWMTRDPLGERGGINAYVYALNDPVNLVDETGLQARARGRAQRVTASALPTIPWTEPAPDFLQPLLTLPPIAVPARALESAWKSFFGVRQFGALPTRTPSGPFEVCYKPPNDCPVSRENPFYCYNGWDYSYQLFGLVYEVERSGFH